MALMLLTITTSRDVCFLAFRHRDILLLKPPITVYCRSFKMNPISFSVLQACLKLFNHAISRVTFFCEQPDIKRLNRFKSTQLIFSLTKCNEGLSM